MKYLLFTFLILVGLVSFAPSAEATVYYIDHTDGSGNDTNDGLTPATAFQSLDAFAEATRTAGDIAFVRRGTASTTNMTDLTFTSSGTRLSPIIISADYDNIWGDFATSSVTVEAFVGSTTLITSASTTDMFPRGWIYISGDCYEEQATTVAVNSCEYAYEIKSASASSIDLYLPYKGGQSGAGLEVRVMPFSPRWGDGNDVVQWVASADNFWFVKGIENQGEDTAGIDSAFAIDTSNGWLLYDYTILINDSNLNRCIAWGNITDSNIETRIKKLRCESIVTGGAGAGSFTLGGSGIDISASIFLEDSLITQSNSQQGGMFAVQQGVSGLYLFIKNTRMVFLSTAVGSTVFDGSASAGRSEIYCVNCELVNTHNWIAQDNTVPNYKLRVENFSSTTAQNFLFDAGISNDNFPTLNSTTTILRSGGGPTATVVTPSTVMNTTWIYGQEMLFEYPIYADTSSKTYSVFFLGSTSTDLSFAVNPTPKELWIECDYLNFPTFATSTSAVKKSTGVLDFVGQPSTWQSLSVTCQPTQAGVLYLRGIYAKTKEVLPNVFIFDTTPVIQ